MRSSYITSAIAGVVVLGLATAAVAATKGEFNNMCTEGLALGKDVPTDCSVNATIKDKTYCFGSEQAKAGPRRQSREGAGLLPKQASVGSAKRPAPNLERVFLLVRSLILSAASAFAVARPAVEVIQRCHSGRSHIGPGRLCTVA
jgi:hypothetical protein